MCVKYEEEVYRRKRYCRSEAEVEECAQVGLTAVCSLKSGAVRQTSPLREGAASVTRPNEAASIADPGEGSGQSALGIVKSMYPECGTASYVAS